MQQRVDIDAFQNEIEEVREKRKKTFSIFFLIFELKNVSTYKNVIED